MMKRASSRYLLLIIALIAVISIGRAITGITGDGLLIAIVVVTGAVILDAIEDRKR